MFIEDIVPKSTASDAPGISSFPPHTTGSSSHHKSLFSLLHKTHFVVNSPSQHVLHRIPFCRSELPKHGESLLQMSKLMMEKDGLDRAGKSIPAHSTLIEIHSMSALLG